MSSSEYDQVQKGSLKLKRVADVGIKKKKKKKKEKELRKRLEQISTGADSGSEAASTSYHVVDKRTKAEMAFDRIKDKRAEEQILEKANKTHKERILDFNSHLDTLTEHFDIPKVSWTK